MPAHTRSAGSASLRRPILLGQPASLSMRGTSDWRWRGPLLAARFVSFDSRETGRFNFILTG